ncbi:PF14066 family protein [Flavobacterium daejeonense]|nr:PF14066 family protein [Flavobacterium daejeonense]
MKKQLTATESEALLTSLKNRFEKNKNRHPELEWNKIQTKLEANPEKLWSLNQMELTEGEADVIHYDTETNTYTFCDCSPESPKGRRSLCYDKQALDFRKENKPKNNVLDVAAAMGISLLNEEEYRFLQSLGNFDSKSSSWIQTPKEIRELGGAIFADFRYNTIFIYHNGAESYYAARGFRASLKI